MSEARGSRIWRDLLIVCVVCFGLLAPFLSKAVNIDDPLYLWTAQQIRAHPLDFYGFDLNWGGHRERMTAVMINPPLLAYYLAAAESVVGSSEVALHVALIPVDLAAAVGMYLLAARFCRYPLTPTLMMLLCPAFCISATSLMCDVPMVCLWIWTVMIWLWASEKALAYLPIAGVLLGMAVLTKYSAVCLLPLLLAHALINRRSWQTFAAATASLLIPVAFVAVYNQFTFARYGHGLFLEAIGFSSTFTRGHSASPMARVLDGIAFVGGGGLAAALVAWVTVGWRSRLAIVCFIPIAMLAAGRLFEPPGGWTAAWCFNLQAGILAAIGFSTVAVCVTGSGANLRDRLFLLLWVGGIFVFATRLNWSINGRSILPLIPPLCILIQKGFEHRKRSIRPIALAMSAGAVFAVLAMITDYRLASANHQAAMEIAHVYRGRKIWFTGHWGFQYYMQQAGALPLDDQRPLCKPGELVVVPLNNYATAPPPGVSLRAIGSISGGEAHWGTLLDGPMGADFYFSPGDRLPFVVGLVPAESLVIFVVTSANASNGFQKP